jgi:hypothetical protein
MRVQLLRSLRASRTGLTIDTSIAVKHVERWQAIDLLPGYGAAEDREATPGDNPVPGAAPHNGLLAPMAERRHGMAEAPGSSPGRSTHGDDS